VPFLEEFPCRFLSTFAGIAIIRLKLWCMESRKPNVPNAAARTWRRSFPYLPFRPPELPLAVLRPRFLLAEPAAPVATRAGRALAQCQTLISPPKLLSALLDLRARNTSTILPLPLSGGPILRVTAAVIGTCLLLSSFSSSESQPQVNLMPMPAQVQLGTGQLVIDRSFSVEIAGRADPALSQAAQRFLDNLSRQTALPRLGLKISESSNAALVVQVEHPAKSLPELGDDESYSLEVNAGAAKLTAVTRFGAMHGLETFLQLVQTGRDGFFVPAVTIHDQPRFAWRGLLIDVSRHFIPIEVLKRNLDGVAAVKLNVLHWHLSDNQGFRVESKKFPELQEMGSDGLFYTQDQVRELIAYAAARGIRVIPEFDMPGHSTAWFVGYPELASAPGPYQIERKWGIFDPAMDPAEERLYKFLDQFIGEMAKLFPDPYFHIGGDEVNGRQWAANPKIQAFMQAHDLKNQQQLQAYFNSRVQRILRKHGKTMVGWDEILQPDLPKDIVIQAWREEVPSPVLAAKQGFRGLLSYGYYLDLMWPAARHYAADPIDDAKLTPEEQQRILGGEACMWSEYVSPENIDSRIWPRLAAIAERLWSPASVRDVNSMYERLSATSRWLDWLGLMHNSSYGPMLQRIAGSDDISSLRVLADVVEPVKDYTREETAPEVPTSLVPLNRLIDAARPESTTAREFAAMVDALVAGQADAATKQKIRNLLVHWQDNDARLQSLESQSFLLKEIMPLSQNLSAVASAGLQALDYLDRGERPPAAWTEEQLSILRNAQEQKAQLLLMVVPPIQKLVQLAAGDRAELKR
jgi:hexosaminidase